MSVGDNSSEDDRDNGVLGRGQKVPGSVVNLTHDSLFENLGAFWVIQ